MKNVLTGKDLSFQYRLRQLISLKKNNSGTAVNMLFSNNKNQNIYTARRPGRNFKCKNQVNLLMIVDGGNSH